MLRYLILAFTGDHAAGVFDAPSAQFLEQSSATVEAGSNQRSAAMQAIGQAGSGLHAALLSATDQVTWGPAF